MKRILTVIGARPQFVKAAAISRVIQQQFSNQLEEILLHTGQHYDENMSAVFFDELNLPKPYVNLNLGASADNGQVKEMTTSIGRAIDELKPNAVLVYGDTNSTRAAAMAAQLSNVPLIHVEAGLRSFNKAMPEEINRIVADERSTLLFVPTEQGMKNLELEGFQLNNKPPFSADNPGVFHCGDVMFDNALYYSNLNNGSSEITNKCGVDDSDFMLATLHRNLNTDSGLNLSSIFKALVELVLIHNMYIVLPLHPRTRKMMQQLLSENQLSEIEQCEKLKLIEPVSYLEMIHLEKKAKLILTDSGGVQKEAFFFKRPCVILRSETEWTELVLNGNAIIAGHQSHQIIASVNTLLEQKQYTWPPYYGQGDAAYFICNCIKSYID